MKVLAGTSGYSYKSWKGLFYPEKLPDNQMLEHYAGQLPAVEVNNTFYRMPTAKLVDRWIAVTPEDFRLVLKMTRRVTHFAKLRPDQELLDYLFGITAGVGPRLGAHLVQLPPYLGKDVEALRSFLQQVPEGDRVAFEFRRESWFDEEVYEVLREHDAALVHADGGKVEVPWLATASWGYLRMRADEYSDEALARWAARVAGQPWDEVLVFFKHEADAAGPRMAGRFLEHLAG